MSTHSLMCLVGSAFSLAFFVKLKEPGCWVMLMLAVVQAVCGLIVHWMGD